MSYAFWMNQKELKLFLHLAKSLSYARTSAACHVTPSSLSRVIQRLETEVGLPLFERDNRHVSLTEAGKTFRVYADEAHNQWLAFRDSLLTQERQLAGEISLFCSVTASYSFLYELLNRFRERFPGIELKLHTGDTAQTLERVRLELEDIGIAALPENLPREVVMHTLTTTPLVFIASEARKDLHTAKELDWNSIPMILSESGLARERVDRWFRAQKIKPSIYAQVAGNEAIVSMVSLGFGVGLVPKLVVDNSPLSQNIRILDVAHGMTDFSIGVCVLKRKLSNPLIKAFWDLAVYSRDLD